MRRSLAGKWDHHWLLGWRDITNSTNERTVIASIVPRVGVGNDVPLMFLGTTESTVVASLAANLSAFALDFSARFKVGGTHLNFFIYEQLAVLPPSLYGSPAPSSGNSSLQDWLAPRIVELTYSSNDLGEFGRDCGYDGPPFRWDEERRVHLCCQRDAAFFHRARAARSAPAIPQCRSRRTARMIVRAIRSCQPPVERAVRSAKRRANRAQPQVPRDGGRR